MIDPERLIRMWEEGKIGNSECESRLCELASRHPPASFADKVPAEFLDEIRERTVNIPRPEDLISIFGGTVILATQADVDAWHQEREARKVRYVEGLRAWKAYYEAVGSPEPEPHVSE